MTDPIKALADAARAVSILDIFGSGRLNDYEQGVLSALDDALAAYDAAQESQSPSDDPPISEYKEQLARLRRMLCPEPAPSDADLESAIDTYRDSCYAHARAATFGEDDDEPSTAQAADAARKALSSLMRSRPDAGLLPPGSILPSAPLVPPHDGLLRAAKAVLAVDVLMRNAQNGMPAHVFNGVLEVLQEEAIPDLRAEVARLEGK